MNAIQLNVPNAESQSQTIKQKHNFFFSPSTMQKIEHDFNYKQNNRCFQDGKETVASQSGTVGPETTKSQVTLYCEYLQFNLTAGRNDNFF